MRGRKIAQSTNLVDAHPTASGDTPQRFVVSPAHAGQRLDRVVAALTSTSRSHIKQLIAQAYVRVNGHCQKAGYIVRAREEIVVFPCPEEPTTALPQEIALDVLYEDEWVVAINKPAGMVVHPAPGQWQGTVVNALLFRWGWAYPGKSLGEAFRPGIVHRLDKDTSGVLLVAKDPRTLEHLAHQFHERLVHKAYGAVVVGRLPSSAGEIALPIGRHPHDRKKMSVHARRGRTALSRYRVAAESPHATFVRLFPETGRTHQLRVHLAALGHPLVGDRVYGSPKLRLLRSLPIPARTFPRQALHAESVRFSHPVRHDILTIHAPYPADFKSLLNALTLWSGKAPEMDIFQLTG